MEHKTELRQQMDITGHETRLRCAKPEKMFPKTHFRLRMDILLHQTRISSGIHDQMKIITQIGQQMGHKISLRQQMDKTRDQTHLRIANLA